MQVFTVRPEGFNEIKKKVVKMMAILFAGIMILVLGVPELMSDQPFQWGTLPYMIVLFGGVFAFSIWNAMKKQKVLFDSFKLTIDDEKIIRERLNTPTITIYKNDVQQIIKGSTGTFAIQGESKLNPIAIPAQMKDYDQLEKILNEIKPLTVRTTKTWVEKMFIPLSLSGVVLMFIALGASNNLLGIVCGILVVAFYVGFFIMIRNNKNVDTKTKRMSYLTFLPLLAVLYNLINRIVG